jgi:ATP-dependent protease Clp ATPase subunit
MNGFCRVTAKQMADNLGFPRNFSGDLAVQVLSVAVHNHYKRIYNESSNKW